MKHSSRKGKTYWNCHLKPECNAKATTTENPLAVLSTSNHGHAADPDYVKARQVVVDIKKTGLAQPDRAPVQIIEQKLQNLPQEVLAKLPQRPAIKRTINRARETELPPNPQAIDLQDLPQEFKLSLRGELFLLYDSYDEREDEDENDNDDPRILVFATRENLRKLSKSST